jgi:signal transduction histidine kinase
VKVSREGTDLCIRVANTGPAPVDAAQNQGTGLRNLRERLGLLGAPVEALTLSRDGEWTVAELRIAVTP